MPELSDQFRTVTLPDVGHLGRTYHWNEPPVAAGHTRLYRFSSGSGRGHYATKPLTAYGTDMYHADIPNESLEEHRQGEHGAYMLDPDKTTAVRKVNWREGTTDKPYELSDWDAYKAERS